MKNTDKNAKIIVTYGRSLIALMIAQSLGARGHEIIGCDSVGMTVLSFSKFVEKNETYACPIKSPEKFIDDLIEIVKKHKPDDDRNYLLMPSFREVKLIAKHKNRFPDCITIAAPSIESIKKVTPKDNFAKTVKDLSVESPQTWLPENEDDLSKISKELSFPVFIKPADDVGGRGISKIENEADLHAGFKKLKAEYPDQQILVQALSKGVDYCFCGLFDNGELVAHMTYHNVQKFPAETGAGVVRETVEDQRFADIAQKLMKPIKWHGVAEIDFMWDETEQHIPEMIEVNPRFWAGLDHSVKSNVDFPHLLYQMFTGQKLDGARDANIGHQTALPIMPALGQTQQFLDTAINFEAMEEKWPSILDNLKKTNFSKAGALFKSAIDGTFSFDSAIAEFKNTADKNKNAEKISYGEDDPFIGLGIMFVLSYLAKNGTLPPELTS